MTLRTAPDGGGLAGLPNALDIMDISAVSSIAANGTSSVAIPVLKGVENLQAAQVDILMKSLGVGNNVNALA